MFKVEYLWNDWVKKYGVNTNLKKYNWPNFNPTIGFVFSLRLIEAFFFQKIGDL